MCNAAIVKFKYDDYMMSFILFLFIIGLVVVLLLPAIILSFFSKLFYLLGFRRRYREHGGETNRQDTGNASAHSAETEKKKENRKKVFDKHEGEYVDFEEIK